MVIKSRKQIKIGIEPLSSLAHSLALDNTGDNGLALHQGLHYLADLLAALHDRVTLLEDLVCGVGTASASEIE